MNRFKVAITSLVLMLGLGIFTFSPVVGAITVFEGCSGGNSTTTVCDAKDKDDANTLVQNVITTLLFAIAIISVVMIIIGGIRYTTSNGDASKVTSAKNTVLYSVIGLIVAMLAYAIVSFVVTRFQ